MNPSSRLLAAAILSVTLAGPSANAAVIRVPNDVSVFSNAVAQAAPGDTVQLVGNGGSEYPSSDVNINKDLTIQGGWRADFQIRDASTYVSVVRDTTSGAFDKPVIRIVGPYRVALDGIWIWGGKHGVLSEFGADLTLRDCTIRGQRNFASAGDIDLNRGGGMRIVGGTTLVDDCLISSITTFFSGAGVAVIDASSFILQNSRIENCNAFRTSGDAPGGGMYARNVADLRLLNSRVVSSATVQNGGLVYLKATGATFADCALLRGVASSNGGAVYLDACPSAVFDRCRMEESFGNLGGALLARSSQGIVLRDCRFASNRALNQGSAMWLEDTAFAIERTEFEHNYIEQAPSTIIPARGGAGYSQQSNGTITDSSFKNERATGKGGAWFQIGGDVTFNGCRFEGNDAGIFGGAVEIELGGRIGLNHCLLVDNRAKFGGAIAASFTGVVNLEHCTVTSGTGRSAGGGIYVDTGGTVVMTNTIACCSLSGEVVYCAGGGVTASHCDVWNDDATNVRVEWGGACADPTGQNGNLKVAPDFCPGDPDYRIASTSACAGAATDGSDLGWQPASCTGPVPTSLRAESWGRLKAMWR